MSMLTVRQKPSLLQRLYAVFKSGSRRKGLFSTMYEEDLRRKVRTVRNATSKNKDPVVGMRLRDYFMKWVLANYIREKAPFLLRSFPEKTVKR